MFKKFIESFKKQPSLKIDNSYFSKFEAIYNSIIESTEGYLSKYKFKGISEYDEISAQSSLNKVEIYFHLLDAINLNNTESKKIKDYNDYYRSELYKKREVFLQLSQTMIIGSIDFDETEFVKLFNTFKDISKGRKSNIRFNEFPILRTINQIIRLGKERQFSENFIQQLNKILNWSEFNNKSYWGSDVEKAKNRLNQAMVTYSSNKQSGDFLKFKFNEDDSFGLLANNEIDILDRSSQEIWSQLLHHANTASGSKPTIKYLKTIDLLIDKINVNEYKKLSHKLLILALNINVEKFDSNNPEHIKWFHQFKEKAFLSTQNTATIKGIVWSLQRFHDAESLRILSDLSLKCFHKIPSVGAIAQALGNACVYVLAQSKGLNGISYLTRLKIRVSQNNTKKTIQKYIDEKAKKLKLLPSQIEEIAVLDYKFKESERIDGFDDYQLKSTITAIGKIAIAWIKPDGKLQKTAPAFIKKSKVLSDKLKNIKAINKQAAQSLTAQRDRLDTMFLENRTWEITDFKKYYLDHGLMGFISKKIVWNLDDKAVIWQGGEWKTNHNQTIIPTSTTKISIWHPVFSTTKEIIAWRDFLDKEQIQQPLKQVYREIYVLTDAEINTNTYSNRMASHILKQHQFNALAKIRNWKYSLMGCFDNGGDSELASKEILAYDLYAEFWINELNDTDSYNDTGIWDYIATDQVRFKNQHGDEIELSNIPALVFSEIMRDCDLFVGVASVGNDPQWQDNGGVRQYHGYWNDYSFGDLSELAKTRKTVLERLVPRLKIANQLTIKDKFLQVKGTKHTYNIHIGSGNILIQPHNKYLCIVAGRSKSKATDNVFLPFEGDRGLSMVLSKAFLLAGDNKIKDKTILSQI